MSNFPDPTSVAKHMIDLSGGPNVAFEKFDAEHKQLLAMWDQNADSIGRILRAHLFVEHFLTELLQAKNPRLGSLDNARLGFAQKVSLLGTELSEIQDLVPGIRRLNKIRNRVAHSLHANLTAEDAETLLSCGFFRAMREESARVRSQTSSQEPLVVIEDFALHVGARIQSSVSGNAALWSEAFRLAENADSDLKSS